MSYCGIKRGESDVYIRADMMGVIICNPCSLANDDSFLGWSVFWLRSEMLEHIKKHRAIGHKVPQYVDERLFREIEEQGDELFPNQEWLDSIADAKRLLEERRR